jgi:hypothetical protein
MGEGREWRVGRDHVLSGRRRSEIESINEWEKILTDRYCRKDGGVLVIPMGNCLADRRVWDSEVQLGYVLQLIR